MKYSPRTANTFDKVCSLRSDNFDVGGFWMSIGEKHVTICAQRIGESPEAMLSIPKKDFNLLLRWYARPPKGRV